MVQHGQGFSFDLDTLARCKASVVSISHVWFFLRKKRDQQHFGVVSWLHPTERLSRSVLNIVVFNSLAKSAENVTSSILLSIKSA